MMCEVPGYGRVPISLLSPVWPVSGGRGDLASYVIAYVADQIGVADDLPYSFSSDTASRQRAGIPMGDGVIHL